ncbi:MAG TPA: hypothetical protein ENI62_08330 [Gammaproteobacteria bacterium]|nr:hypothetical protein [Gammaproteobacteria bacterium]
MGSEMDIKGQELNKLLPWYVNGTLAGEERERVEAYVEQDQGGQIEVAFLRSVQTAIREQQDEVVSPAEVGWRRLQKTIAEQRHEAPLQTGKQRHWWRPTLAAAALLLLVQGGVLVQIWPVYKQHYTVLSSSRQGATGIVLQVSFDPAISEEQLRGIINNIEAQIVGGPGALGIYRLRLPAEIKQTAAINRLIRRLRDTPGVTTVEQD